MDVSSGLLASHMILGRVLSCIIFLTIGFAFYSAGTLTLINELLVACG